MPERQASANLLSSIADGKPTLALLLKITRTDDEVIGFTTVRAGATYDGVDYSPGLDPTIIVGSSNLSVDNLESDHTYQTGIITEADVAAGTYDKAHYDLMVFDAEVVADGDMVVQSGNIRKIESKDSKFTLSLASISALLQSNVGRLASPNCDANFGDARCGINLAGNHPTLAIPYRLASATVVTVPNRISFTITNGTYPTAFFQNGKATFLTGTNTDVICEVKSYVKSGSTGTVTLFELPRKGAIIAGDTLSLTAGCGKTYPHCLAFDNVVNFRGLPYLQGIRRLLTSR